MSKKKHTLEFKPITNGHKIALLLDRVEQLERRVAELETGEKYSIYVAPLGQLTTAAPAISPPYLITYGTYSL